MKLAVVIIGAAASAHAQEFVRADGALSDSDFYGLVSCAAPPAGVCQKETVRWSPADAQDLSIGFVQIERGYPQALSKKIAAALADAIEQINITGADLHLTLWDGYRKPDIGLHLLTIVEGDIIKTTGLAPLDGAILAAAKTQLWWRSDHSLIEGAIVFGSDINSADLPSIMLEEVTQSMGLLTDIGGPYYQTRSIFSEISNQMTELGVQDIMALRRHYP